MWVWMTSVLVGVSSQLHALAALPLGKTTGTHRIGGWVRSRAGLGEVEKREFLTLPGLELRPSRVDQPLPSRYANYAIPAPVSFAAGNVKILLNKSYMIQEDREMTELQRLKSP
jgi:hypothetical protein